MRRRNQLFEKFYICACTSTITVLKGCCRIFTALHEMQTRSSDENSVRPSVCHARGLWQNGRKIGPDFYTIRRNNYPSFLRRRMVGGGATPSTWNFGLTDPRLSEIANFQPIIARSSSAVTPSEKSSINSNRKSTTRFPMSLRWSSYVAPKSPKGGFKNAKRPIFIKKYTSLEESVLQFLCVKTLSGKVVRHSLA